MWRSRLALYCLALHCAGSVGCVTPALGTRTTTLGESDKEDEISLDGWEVVRSGGRWWAVVAVGV